MTSILRTMRQTNTPLGNMFFSDFNLGQIQNTIRKTFRDKTGISIDNQNQRDVLTLMRMVFINNSIDQYSNLPEQVQLMNSIVVKTAVGQISTGVSQYIGYIKDISNPLLPEPRPITTSLYGQRM
jgi:hypothetical protein